MNPILIKGIKKTGVYLLKIILLAVIYHLAARLGLRMAYVQVNTSPVWPPAGIALAALLLFGLELWPGVVLGVFVGSLLTDAPLNLAFGMTIGNTLEAVVGAFFLRRVFHFHNTLDRIQDVIALVLVSFSSTTLSATGGTLTLMLTGNGSWSAFGAIWITWWIGDLLGALVVTPLLLVWLTPSGFSGNWRRYLEVMAATVLLSGVTWYVFSNNPPTGILHQALLYVIFPFIIWVSLRFNQRGAAIAVFIVSGIAIWNTIQSQGPFSYESLNDSLVLLQTFMAVVSLISLILAATTMERQKSAVALRQKVEDLATLNKASETFLGAFDQTSIYQTICQLAVSRFEVGAAWIEIADWATSGFTPKAAEGIALEKLDDLHVDWEAVSDCSPLDSVIVKTMDTKKRAGNYSENPFTTFAEFPIAFGTQRLGSLKLLSKDLDFFTQDRQLLIQSFANLAAVTIQNSWLLESVRRGNEQLHALSQRLMKAQEEERLHLSRELHDESGQLLAALSVELGLLERDTDKGPKKDVKAHISALKRITDEIQNNLHKLAVLLRPASLDHLGLVTALQQYVSEFSRQYDIKVEYEATGMTERRLPNDVETAVFRIVQESLTNVVLHAQATRVDILLNRHNDHLIAVVEDNGVGFTQTANPLEDHLGLFGMRERIEMLNGHFTIESSPGKGTTVKVEVPVND